MRIIAGAHKGRVLRTVDGPGYRPAMSKVRESLFSLLEARGVIWGGLRVLDLFAGSGSLGFEALSRGALEAVFVENAAQAANCLEKNSALLGAGERCRILKEDVLRVTARRPAHPFQIIFVDPPYGAALFQPALRNILRLGWLAPDGFLIAEVEKQLALHPEQIAGLELETERHYGNTRILVWTPAADATAPTGPLPVQKG